MASICIYRTDISRWRATDCLSLLDEGEHRRAGEIGSMDAWCEFVIGRAFLRCILSSHTTWSPQSLRFATEAVGKPVLHGSSCLHFNLSHSRGTVVVAVAPTRVGVDIEHIDQEIDHVAVGREVYSDAELECLRDLDGVQLSFRFHEIWTRKEAYLKATGLGFSANLRAISVAMSNGLVRDRSQSAESPRWYSHPLDLGRDFKAAVASATPYPRIVYCQHEPSAQLSWPG